MAKNDAVRILGGKAENASGHAIKEAMVRNKIVGDCTWNKFNEETCQYEKPYTDECKHGDLKIVIIIDESRRDSFGVHSKYRGIIERLIEVKYDYFCLNGSLVSEPSLKVAIETFSEERSNGIFIPSGINTTKSDYWLIIISDGRYWVTPTDALRKLCHSNKLGIDLKTAFHQDDSNVMNKLHCIPLRYLDEICIDSGSDIKDIDIIKVLYGENHLNWFPHDSNKVKGF